MRRLAAAALALTLAAPALAQDRVVPDATDPVTLRITEMKQVGAAIGTLAAMAKQERPFDADLAHMSLRVMLSAASGYGALFPEGSETGHDTRAAPAIWSDRAGFDKALAEFLAAADAAVQAPPTELAALGPTLQSLGRTCQSCHEGYRVKKD